MFIYYTEEKVLSVRSVDTTLHIEESYKVFESDYDHSKNYKVQIINDTPALVEVLDEEPAE